MESDNKTNKQTNISRLINTENKWWLPEVGAGRMGKIGEIKGEHLSYHIPKWLYHFTLQEKTCEVRVPVASSLHLHLVLSDFLTLAILVGVN